MHLPLLAAIELPIQTTLPYPNKVLMLFVD